MNSKDKTGNAFVPTVAVSTTKNNAGGSYVISEHVQPWQNMNCQP